MHKIKLFNLSKTSVCVCVCACVWLGACVFVHVLGCEKVCYLNFMLNIYPLPPSTPTIYAQQNSKRSSKDLAGRNEANTRVIFPKADLPSNRHDLELSPVMPGDYVAVQVCSQLVVAKGMFTVKPQQVD